jgi:hypothetical protein
MICPLSERERRFVEAFMGPAKGNGAAAARIAGYANRSARVTASRLLTKANIRRAIEARVQDDPLVATREQLQQFWSAIVLGRGSYVLLEMRDRLRASELLERSPGGFSDKVRLDPGRSLEELLDEAERLWRANQAANHRTDDASHG